jgi:hypothetical protein
MEYKIIKYSMKSLILVFTFFFACTPNQKTTQVEHSDVILNNEGDWNFSFKGLIFLDLIKKLNQAQMNDCIIEDRSVSSCYEGINMDTSVYSIVKNIVDSLIKKRPTIYNDKSIIQYALDIRISERLDSLAGLFYRKFRVDSFEKNTNLSFLSKWDTIRLYNEGKWQKSFKGLVFLDIINKINLAEGNHCPNIDISQTAFFAGIYGDTAVYSRVKKITDLRLKQPWGTTDAGPNIFNYALDYRLSSELDSIVGVCYKQFNISALEHN